MYLLPYKMLPKNQLIRGIIMVSMNPPLLSQEGQGPSPPVLTKEPPTVSSGGFEYSKPSNPMGQAMGGYSADGGSSWDSAF